MRPTGVFTPHAVYDTPLRLGRYTVMMTGSGLVCTGTMLGVMRTGAGSADAQKQLDMVAVGWGGEGGATGWNMRRHAWLTSAPPHQHAYVALPPV